MQVENEADRDLAALAPEVEQALHERRHATMNAFGFLQERDHRTLDAQPTNGCTQVIEKHDGDTRVPSKQLDEMIGEFDAPTRNLPEPSPSGGLRARFEDKETLGTPGGSDESG